MSPLHAACEGGREEFVVFLLKLAGDRKIECFDQRDSDNKLPFELAMAVR